MDDKPQKTRQNLPDVSSHLEQLRKKYTSDSGEYRMRTTQRAHKSLFFHQYLSERFSPSVAFIDVNYNLLFISGSAKDKILISDGVFEGNLLDMLPQEIREQVRQGVKQASERKQDILLKGLVLQEQQVVFDLHVHPMLNEIPPMYLLQFGEDQPNHKASVIEAEALDHLPRSKEDFKQIEELLQNTELELLSAMQKLEIANEHKAQIGSEFESLLKSTDIATVFLDEDLIIRRFTPRLKDIFFIDDSDIGRGLEAFSSVFSEDTQASIIKNTGAVLRKLVPIQEEVIDKNGYIYLQKINPFITSDNKIEGVVVSFVDLKEVKKLEKAKELPEKRYAKLFNNLGIDFLHVKAIYNRYKEVVDFEVINANPSFSASIGESRSTLEGTSFSELFSSLSTAEFKDWMEKLSETVRTGQGQYLEGSFPRLQGYYIIHVFSPDAGELAITFDDITKIRTLQEELINSNNILMLATNLSGIALWEWDVVNDKIEGSQDFQYLYGFNGEYAMKAFDDNLHPKDKKEALGLIKRLLRGEESRIRHEFRYVHPATSEEVWIKNVSKVMESDSNGNALKILGVSQNITQEKKSILLLEEERQFSKRIMEVSNNGVIIRNIQNWEVEYISPACADILGYQMKDFKDMSEQHFRSLYHPDDINRVLTHKNDIIKHKDEQEIEYRFKHKTGRWVWCYSVDTPFEYDKDGNVLSIIGVFMDITDRKSLELMLNETKQAAERANAEKSRFLANMSHEIRTPLNSVIGFSELLQKSALDFTQKKHLDAVYASAISLLSLIDDILDLSKIEAGLLSLYIEKLDLWELVDQLASMFQYKTESDSKVEFKVDIAANVPRFVWADSTRMRQVLTNLLGNAMKFTAAGYVKLSVSCENEEVEGRAISNMRFSVEDTGIGISPEQQQNIFQAFKQADDSTTRNFGGTGLGLSISKNLLEMMDSQMQIESAVGEGSRFFFDLQLPFENSNYIGLKSLQEGITAAVIALHSKPLAHWLFELLSSVKIKCILLQEEQKIEDITGNFNLCLVDEGYLPEAQRYCSAKQQDSPKILFLQSESERIFEVQENTAVLPEHVSATQKLPWLPSRLLKLLLHLYKEKDTSLEQKVMSQRNRQKQRTKIHHILIVDDNQVNLVLARSILNILLSEQLKVTEANNGKEALEIIEQETIDLVLMDVHMPIMNGFEATEELRKKSEYKYLPVIALTAGVTQEERRECFNAGMSDYLSKPVVADKLKEVFRKWLPSAFEGQEEGANKLEHFNRSDLLVRLGNNKKGVELALDAIRNGAISDDIEGLLALLSNESYSFEEVKKVAHTIKGSARSMGFEVLGEQAEILENMSSASRHEIWELAIELRKEIRFINETYL